MSHRDTLCFCCRGGKAQACSRLAVDLRPQHAGTKRVGIVSEQRHLELDLCSMPRPDPPQVPDLSAFSALRHLELSYNAVHSLAPLKACGATRLEELYAASNKIAEVR